MSSIPIPGWAYLIIGASVSSFSKFVESKKAGTNLTIFFYIGLIFIAIGIFKIAINYVSKSKKQKQVHHMKKDSIKSNPMHNQNLKQNNMQNQAFNQNINAAYQQQTQNQRNFQNQSFQNQQNYQNQSGFIHNNNSNNDNNQNKSWQDNSKNQTSTEQFHHISEVKKTSQPEHMSIITCPGCGIKHYSYANYCMMCGSTMRK